MAELFVTVYRKNGGFYVKLESYVTIFVYVLSEADIKLKINFQECDKGNLIQVDLQNIEYDVVDELNTQSLYCKWPVLVKNNYTISGLCSITRHIIKNSKKDSIKKLLGFRDASLMACSESSIWTRFCEIDMIETTKNIIEAPQSFIEENTFILPANICRFNFHMQQPVRMHNVYKIARESNNDNSIESSTPLKDLRLSHTYGEGPFMTLADAILYPCFNIFFKKCQFDMNQEIPDVIDWFKNLKQEFISVDNKIKIIINKLEQNIKKVLKSEFLKHSLYTADPNRYRPEKRIFTKQNDIENAIKIVKKLSKNIKNDNLPYGHEVSYNWDNIPLDANPLGGALPEKRAARKCEQLENLAKSVIKIAKDKNYKIVDFCSGSGHLGILLAYLLPKSTIILVENKEKSLERAVETIKKLNLVNVEIVQSNLDYFIGGFDVGVALHACGVATDLVLQKCIDNAAHFVICPCCYGGIKNCHVLTYPRSVQFKNLDLEYKNFLSLAHAADQTHDKDNVKTKQGFYCMDVVDTDRKLYAESWQYAVHLGKLQPVSCTNKNNLLVGIRG